MSEFGFPKVVSIDRLAQVWVVRFEEEVTQPAVNVLSQAVHADGYGSISAWLRPNHREVSVSFTPHQPNDIKDWLCKYFNYVPSATSTS